MVAQALHVLDKVPGGVFGKFGVRCRVAAAALIEEHDAVGLGIMHLAQKRRYSAAWTAMQNHDGLSCGIAAFLEIDFMKCGHAQATAIEGLLFRVECPPLHDAVARPQPYSTCFCQTGANAVIDPGLVQQNVFIAEGKSHVE